MIFDKSHDLFSMVLENPALELEADRLLIVSGYASPSMASFHLLNLKNNCNINDEIKVEVLIGMGVRDGIFRPEKKGFEEVENTYANFECRYVVSGSPVHSKIYVWCKGPNPLKAFIGSANYTQNGFGNYGQDEIVSIVSEPKPCLDYYSTVYKRTAELADYRVDGLIEKYIKRVKKQKEQIDGYLNQATNTEIISELHQDSVNITFLDSSGKLPTGGSGLNWGHRPNRNPNEAYIKIPAEIARRKFFPPKKKHFTLQTDDDKYLLCLASGTQGEDEGKQIISAGNNSLMGEYFRNRLNLSSGSRVTQNDLERYGRTDVTITKIDDDNYFMDFSPPAPDQS